MESQEYLANINSYHAVLSLSPLFLSVCLSLAWSLCLYLSVSLFLSPSLCLCGPCMLACKYMCAYRSSRSQGKTSVSSSVTSPLMALRRSSLFGVDWLISEFPGSAFSALPCWGYRCTRSCPDFWCMIGI